MGSLFSDNHLAESVGYGTGRRHGEIEGRNHGYNDGWNDAVAEATHRINEANHEIGRLSGLVQERDAIIARLRNELDASARREQELARVNQLRVEQAGVQQKDYEHLLKSFLGVVSIAHPAIKALATLPFERKNALALEYGTMAEKLLTTEYVMANNFPHNQPMIRQYLPIAGNVFEDIRKERIARREQQAHNEAVAS